MRSWIEISSKCCWNSTLYIHIWVTWVMVLLPCHNAWEAVEAWMWDNGLWLNPGKTELLWVHGASKSGSLTFLVLLHYPIQNQFATWEFFCSYDFCVKIRSQSCFGEPLHNFSYAPSVAFPGSGPLYLVTHILVITHLDYCNVLYVGLPLKCV